MGDKLRCHVPWSGKVFGDCARGRICNLPNMHRICYAGAHWEEKVTKIKKIEILFPCDVEIGGDFSQDLQRLIGKLCHDNSTPAKKFYISEGGAKLTYVPETEEEEKTRGMEFDESVFCLRIGVREGGTRKVPE